MVVRIPPEEGATVDGLGLRPLSTLPAGPGTIGVPPGPMRSMLTPRAAGPGDTGTPPGPIPPGVKSRGCDGPGTIGVPPGPIVCAAPAVMPLIPIAMTKRSRARMWPRFSGRFGDEQRFAQPEGQVCAVALRIE